MGEFSMGKYTAATNGDCKIAYGCTVTHYYRKINKNQIIYSIILKSVIIYVYTGVFLNKKY